MYDGLLAAGFGADEDILSLTNVECQGRELFNSMFLEKLRVMFACVGMGLEICCNGIVWEITGKQ